MAMEPMNNMATTFLQPQVNRKYFRLLSATYAMNLTKKQEIMDKIIVHNDFFDFSQRLT